MLTHHFPKPVTRRTFVETIQRTAKDLHFSCVEEPLPFRFAESGIGPGKHPGSVIFQLLGRVGTFEYVRIRIHARSNRHLLDASGRFSAFSIGAELLYGTPRFHVKAPHPGLLFHQKVAPIAEGFLVRIQDALGPSDNRVQQ